LYEWLLLAHILAVVIWIGGAITFQIHAVRVDRAGQPAELVALASEGEWLGLRLFMPAALVALAAGIGLVIEGNWSFGEAWILFGLLAYAISFLNGALFLGPESGRLSRLIAERGPEDPQVRWRIRRIFLASRVELVILVAIIADMVLKPGT
jgi:uncharacterized membrane protein